MFLSGETTAEKILLIKQYSDFRTEFFAADPEIELTQSIQPVEHLNHLTPYGMLLHSLAGCTAIVLHTFAQHHQLPFEIVEMRMAYDRFFNEDCEHCEEDDKYSEEIKEEINLIGNLSQKEKRKLLKIAHHCPIYKMLANGIPVRTALSN